MPTWQELQDRGHGADHDYERRSPHLVHARLRNQIAEQIRHAVGRSFARHGDCRVLEIGAGHGAFTEFAAAAGACVTVTEMSASSASGLDRRFVNNDRIRVIHDPDGESVLREDQCYDLILCISVLHHIPDYLGCVKRLTDVVAPGGDLISFQDPMWYARRSRLNMSAQWGAYFAWRVFQGDLVRRLRTRGRHLREIRDERLESDMVEYPIVRQGVDELALQGLLGEAFNSVSLVTYWSTQSPALQELGDTLGLRSTFGLIATGRR
jgi:SAM-dependent methyltransferase